MFNFLKNLTFPKSGMEGPTRPHHPLWKTLWKPVLTLACLVLIVQASYYTGVFASLNSDLPPADMVVIYSGGDDRTAVIQRYKGNPKLVFLFSGWDYSPDQMEKTFHLGSRMLVEDKARTTDQNARFCAPIIRQAGVRSVALALPWYHLPRALFLTRLYLRGSGVVVHAYATVPLPDRWWANREFYLELAKFWGSMVRIGLSWAGIETWPKPSGGY